MSCEIGINLYNKSSTFNIGVQCSLPIVHASVSFCIYIVYGCIFIEAPSLLMLVCPVGEGFNKTDGCLGLCGSLGKTIHVPIAWSSEDPTASTCASSLWGEDR